MAKKPILEHKKYDFEGLNTGKKIKLHYRKRKSLYYLYMETSVTGKKKQISLRMALFNTIEKFSVDKETIRQALIVRDTKELQIDPNNKEAFTFRSVSSLILFNEYFKRITKTKTGATKASYQNTLKHLENYKHKPILKAVNNDFLKGFIHYLQQQELSRNTILLYTSKIKTVLNGAVKDGFLKYNPVSVLVKKKESKREFLTLEEIKLFQAVHIPHCEETKQAFLFSCFTGLRLSDVRKLKFSDIQENYVVFQQQKTKGFERLPLSETALKIIEHQRQFHRTKNVFHISTTATISRHIKKLTKQAGIQKHITFHCARHTFATLNLTMGNDIYSVSKLLGHKDLKTTQIYAKLVDEKLKTAVNKLPVL